MFDYVNRSELDTERERRIRAETERDSSAREVNRLLDALESERIQRENESVRHAQQVERILNHIAPLAPVVGDAAFVSPEAMTPLERLMMMPARGPGEIEAKRNAINLYMRDQEGQKGRVPSSSDDELTPDEEARIAERVTAADG